MNSTDNVFRVIWGPQRFYLSLGWKTLIAFALVVFLPMGGLLVITEQTMRDTLERKTEHTLEANLRSARTAYQRPMEDVRIALVQASSSERTSAALAQRDAAALFRILERQAKRFSYVDLWFAVDKSQTVRGRKVGALGGHYDFGTGLERALGSLRDNPITTELLSRELFISEDPQRFVDLPPLVLAQVIVAPVSDQGALVGVMLLHDNQLLLQQIQNQLMIENTFVILTHGERVIASANLPGETLPIGSKISSELTRAIERSEIFSDVLENDGVRTMLLGEPILNGDYQSVGGLVLVVGDKMIASSLARNSRQVYLFITFGIALSLLIAYLAYRDTLRPLRAIVDAQNAFAEGAHDVRTEIITRDEFESLGAGFNRMAEAVVQHDRRLTQYTNLSSLANLSLSSQELLQRTLDKVVDISRGALGVIYLREEGSNRLAPHAAHAVDLEELEILKVGEGIPGQAALERKTHVFENDELDTTSGVVLHLGVGSIPPRQLVYFPLIFRGELLGLLLLGFTHPCPEKELLLLEHLSRQVAIILSDTIVQRRIDDLQNRDPLTGIANRAHFTAELDRQFNESQRYGTDLSLLMVDIDHFRQFADRFGYHMADVVLTTVSGVLGKTIRNSDILARFSDNKFALILPHTDLEQAMITAEKVRKNLIGTSVGQLDRERITISIGVASYPDPAIQAPVEMVRRADQALYKAKQGGRNRVESVA